MSKKREFVDLQRIAKKRPFQKIIVSDLITALQRFDGTLPMMFMEGDSGDCEFPVIALDIYNWGAEDALVLSIDVRNPC